MIWTPVIPNATIFIPKFTYTFSPRNHFISFIFEENFDDFFLVSFITYTLFQFLKWSTVESEKRMHVHCDMKHSKFETKEEEERGERETSCDDSTISNTFVVVNVFLLL